MGSSHQNRTVVRQACGAIILVAVAIGAAYIAGVYTTGNTLMRTGVAADMSVDGNTSGFYSLSVRSPTLGGAAAPNGEVDTGEYTGEITADQQRSLDTGWVVACSTWAHFGVLGVDQALTCASSTHRPDVTHSGRTHGASAMLRDTLAFIDHHFDINGELTVASTGELYTDPMAPQGSPLVVEIGGVPEKARAAVAADVDVLLVPAANYNEFAAQEQLVNSGIRIVAVFSVTEAVRELCELSRTNVCVTRVLA